MASLQEYKDAYRRAYEAEDYEAAKRILNVIEQNTDAAEESFSVGQFLKENMEIPLGLGGAAAGAGTGFLVAGPPGALLGSIIGGALGSGTGSIASDVFEGTDPDYAKALEEALISAGIDVVTLGVGSKIKPFLLSAKAARMDPLEAAEMFVKEAAMDAGEQAQATIAKAAATEGLARSSSMGLAAGSPESLRESQRLAEEAGASFTPSQTGSASSLQILSEGIANLGLLSSQTMQRNAERIEGAAQSAISQIINRSPETLDDPAALGEALNTIITTGKKAASDNYVRSIDEIKAGVRNNQVSKTPLKVSLTQFLKKNKRSFGSMLDDRTIKYVENMQTRLASGGSKIDVSELIDFQTAINKEIRKLGNLTSKDANPDLVPEFSQLSSNLRGVIQRALERTNPDLARQYKETKKAFGIATEGLLPVINKSFITNAKKGNYTPLGKVLTHTGNVDQIRALMGSIDEAYRLMPSSARKDLPIKSPEEARAAIKSAFLSQKFSTAQGAFDADAYVKMAAEFQQPDKAARMAAILGKDTPTVKQVMNLISEASEQIEGNLGSLLFRSKEYRAAEAPIRAAGMVGQSASIMGGIGAGVLDLLTSGMIITLPVVLAKISTNPKLANKLLAFEKKTFPSEEAKLLFANQIVNEVVSDMTEEERQSLKDSIRSSSDKDIVTRGQRQQQAVGM
jgi:hypothetical protein